MRLSEWQMFNTTTKVNKSCKRVCGHTHMKKEEQGTWVCVCVCVCV